MKNLLLFISCTLVLFVFTSCKPIHSASGVNAENRALGSKKQKVIILAGDGGGVKGIIPAIFLDSIEARTKKQSFE